RLQSSRMASIYERSHLVLAATRAATGDMGMFNDRMETFELNCDNIGTSFKSYVRKKISHRDFGARYPVTFQSQPVFGRAWCFQERLLGRRVLHFTENELVWEC